VPTMPNSAVLIDFDAELLKRAVRDTGHTGYHAVGIRTSLPDGAVDSVIVTSRMAGIWPYWAEEITKEAARIGRLTQVSDQIARIGQHAPLQPTAAGGAGRNLPPGCTPNGGSRSRNRASVA